MPKLTEIQDYLSQDELKQRYSQAAEVVERIRWQIIWLLATKKPVKEVAVLTGFTQGWVRELARRYNKEGPAGLDDRRKQLPGVPPLLTKELQAELDQALQQSPPEGGQWNGPLVAKWIAAKIGRKVQRQVGWAYLQKLDYTLQQPRPHHALGNPKLKPSLKKTRRASS
jgi:transposase